MLTMQAFQNLVTEVERVLEEAPSALSHIISDGNPDDIIIDKNDPGLKKALENAAEVFSKHSGPNARKWFKEQLARSKS